MTNVISKVIHNGTEYGFNGVNGGVTSVNGNTGAVTVNDVKTSASAPSNPTEGMAWYDTTNDALKVYDGSNWIQTGAVTSVNGQTGAVTVSEVPSGGNNGDVLTNVSGTPTWQAPTGGVQMSTITVTLTSAGWSSNSQTVSATGVTASNTVIVSPAPANINDYASNSVYCESQGSGTLTFKCNTTPDGDISVNVLILS